MPPTRQAPDRQERLSLYEKQAIHDLEQYRAAEMRRRYRLQQLLKRLEFTPAHDEEARAVGRHRAHQISVAVRDYLDGRI